MDGVLIIDKPEGLTSHDVVATIRRLLPRDTKVGHTGTLDPFATGVLPIVIGKASRLARFLSGDDKRYLATVAFGHSTTTYDRTGEAVASADANAVQALTAAKVEDALRAFVGVISQTPPVFSAKKRGGVRAYQRARQGDTTLPDAVDVVAYALGLVAWDRAGSLATLDVHTGPGFYVRSLAHDLGVALGVPAHLQALRRTVAGPFSESDALPLGALAGPTAGALADHVRGTGALLTDLPALTVGEAQILAIGHGQVVSVPRDRVTSGVAAVAVDERVRLLADDGRLLALATRQATASGDDLVRLHADIVLL